jgi:hypothetical protein
MQRRTMVSMAVSGLLTGAAAQAQSKPKYAALSLIGDRIEVVVPQMTTGASTSRNLRQGWDDPAGSFDKIALGALSRGFERVQGAGAALTMLALPPGPLHQRGDELVEGRQARLPANLLSALQGAGATHLLLMLKHRGDARIPIREGHTGIGKVRGLGFYVDAHYESINVETGHGSTGFLAPYVYLRLLAIELAAGAVQREQFIQAMELLPARNDGKVRDPWDLLDSRQKSEHLRGMLERELERALPGVIG